MFQKRPVRIAFFIFAIFLMASLVRSILSVREKENIVIEEEKRLEALKKEKKILDQSLEKLDSPLFLEKQAREKLNLGKDGEYVVVLPISSPFPSPTPSPVLEHWEEWKNLVVY